MGVTCVSRWNDANGTQSLLQLQDRIINIFQGALTGRWTGSLKLFRDSVISANARKQANIFKQQSTRQTPAQLQAIAEIEKHKNQTLYQLTLSSEKDKVFSWTPDAFIESDYNLEPLLLKLHNVWVPRQSATIEGYAFDLGDFVIRAGNLMIGSSYKGIIIEVEYLPCNHPGLGLPLAQEFLAMILPQSSSTNSFPVAETFPPSISFVPLINWADIGLSVRTYSSLHTSYQYQVLFHQDKLL